VVGFWGQRIRQTPVGPPGVLFEVAPPVGCDGFRGRAGDEADEFDVAPVAEEDECVCGGISLWLCG
jgi:hypothetical protein